MGRFDLKSHKRIWILICGVILYIALFFTLTVLRYKAFFSYEWEDLAHMNGAYWNVSQGNMIGFIKFLFQDNTHDVVHIAPIMFVISAIYFFVPHIYTLFFVVTLSLAIAAVPIYFIGMKLLKNDNAALLFSIAYLLYAPKNIFNFLDGDTSIFLIPLLLFTFYAVLAGNKVWFVVCSILVMLCKTETPVYIIVFALYFLIKQQEFHKIPNKMYLTMGGIAGVLFVLNIFFFQLLSEEDICYSCRGSSFIGAVSFVATYPILDMLSDIQIQSLLKMVFPVVFFPVFTAEIFLGLPSLLAFILAGDFVHQRAHYLAGFVPAIFIGSIYFVRRLYVKFWTQFSPALAAIIFLGCLFSNFTDHIIGGPYPVAEGFIPDIRFLDVRNLYDKRFYVMDDEDKIAWRMIRMIPKDPNIAISASGDLLAPLSSRKKLIEFLDDDYDYYNVDYILIHNKYMYMGAGHYFWDGVRMDAELEKLLANNDWVLIAQEGTFYLFRRK